VDTSGLSDGRKDLRGFNLLIRRLCTLFFNILALVFFVLVDVDGVPTWFGHVHENCSSRLDFLARTGLGRHFADSVSKQCTKTQTVHAWSLCYGCGEGGGE